MTSNISQNDWTLIHLAEQRDTSGAVERHLLASFEEVKLQAPTRCTPARKHLGAPRATPHHRTFRCPAVLPAGTPPSSRVVLCSSATGTSGTSQPPSRTSPSWNACFSSLRSTESRQRQGPDPLGKPQPDLGTLHAGDFGIHVLPRQ